MKRPIPPEIRAAIAQARLAIQNAAARPEKGKDK